MPHLALPLNAYDASTRYGASWSSQSRWQWGGTWHPVSRSILERHRDNLEYIHVKLVDFGQLHNNVHPLQVATFPLDRSGAFDMGKVQRAWGLRHCSVSRIPFYWYQIFMESVSRLSTLPAGRFMNPQTLAG